MMYVPIFFIFRLGADMTPQKKKTPEKMPQKI